MITQKFSFIFAAAALLLLAHSAKQAAAPIEPAQPTAVPTFHCLGLSWSPSQGSVDNPCQVRYRRSGTGSWSEALPLWFDGRNREYRGSIVNLTPGRNYEVSLTLRATQTTARLKAITWSETFPVGETVRLPRGVTDAPYAVTRSGTSGRYVLYTPPSGGSTIIDVANRADACLTIAASYVIVRGLTLKGAAQHGIRLLEGAHHVVIEKCDISGWGGLRDPAHGWGADENAAIYARRLPGLQEIVIQRNRLHHPRYTTNSWKDGHPAGPQGITFDLCGGHNVIRYNEIYGDDTHYFNDGIGGSANFSNEGFPNHDSDIYGNVVRHCMDDAIEVEGGDRNVRVWGNYLDHDQCGIASAACALGPLYIFRNVMAVSRWTPETGTSDEDERGPFGKLGDSRGFGGGRRFFFHNTLLQPTQPGSRYPLGAGLGPADYGGPMTNTVSRNNIWHVFRPEALSISDGRASTTNDLDYDLTNARIKAAPGAEPHGIKGVPLYASGHGPANPAGGRYQLAPTSPGYDGGVRLLSNLKQIGTAAMMYVQDYDETYPNNLALSIPGPLYGTNWDAWHKAKIAPTFSISATGGTYVADSSVAEQLYPYVKNLPVYLCTGDVNGDRFASGRWTNDKFRLSYYYNHGVSLGFNDCKPSGRPHTIASISRPALLHLAQDNWAAMHSPGNQSDARWNIMFADGHAKFTRWIDSWVTNTAQRPWAWHYCNPQSPVNLEQPCSPDCKTVAAQ